MVLGGVLKLRMGKLQVHKLITPSFLVPNFNFQAELNSLTMRVDSAEEYLKNLIGVAMEEYKRGEWATVVKTKIRTA